MKLQTLCLSLAALLCFPTAARTQAICADDNGNACLKQCGILTETCYDLATEDPDGPFEESLFSVRCKLNPTCIASGQGINYCMQQGDCSDTADDASRESRIEALHRAAPSAPIFIASCSGNLVQVDLPRKQNSAQTVHSLLRPRPLLSQQVERK